ncbi:nucleotidyltransferase domain-containing protein [Candidatus Gottesmanbacteria bacterium]|nr:nucleotidyltransferase domain-containing protein [Candidatus Gottesmanbacteria bacterium]
MDIQQIINAVKQYKPQRIIMFGSASSGSLKPDSDLDIAIVKQTSKPYHDRVIDVRRLVRSTTPVDFFVFTPEEIEKQKEYNPFIRDIVTTGRIVYEAA